MVKVSEVRIGNFLLFDFPDKGRVQYKSERINNNFDGFKTVASINDLHTEKNLPWHSLSQIVGSQNWVSKKLKNNFSETG